MIKSIKLIVNMFNIIYNEGICKYTEDIMEVCRIKIENTTMIINSMSWPIVPLNKKITSTIACKRTISFHVNLYVDEKFIAMFHLNRKLSELKFFEKINKNTSKEELLEKLFINEDFSKFLKENWEKNYELILLNEKLKETLEKKLENPIRGSVKRKI
jgi:hypothetical protein